MVALMLRRRLQNTGIALLGVTLPLIIACGAMAAVICQRAGPRAPSANPNPQKAPVWMTLGPADLLVYVDPWWAGSLLPLLAILIPPVVAFVIAVPFVWPVGTPGHSRRLGLLVMVAFIVRVTTCRALARWSDSSTLTKMSENLEKPSSDPLPQMPGRVGSIDAYRGLVMFLMMAEVLALARVAKALPDSAVWQWLAYHQTHVAWRGCSLHDLIQPSFSFLVGVALPFSLASRKRRGEPLAFSLAHAAWRAALLVLLGIFLRSVGRPATNFTFEDTLTQIGLGYFPLFLIGLGPPKLPWAALALILVGYWAAFALYPLPDGNFNYDQVGVPQDWQHNASGFAAHWNKNTNAAWAFDRWFLNLFHRAQPFMHNGGGYATLSFIPTLGTMLLGLIAGGWLRLGAPASRKLAWMTLAGIAGLALGYAADCFGLCLNVKRIWTPAWVLFSGGWCFLLLAAFYLVIDVAGLSAWSYPLRVVGANSIAAYLIAHLCGDFIRDSFHTHLGPDLFRHWGEAYEPFLAGAAVLSIYWLMLWWMYRRKFFLRI